MNRRLAGCLIGFLVLTTAAGYTFSLVAATPEEALRLPFSCPGKPNVEAEKFQVLTVRKWSKGIVALYQGICPSQNKQAFNQQVLSYRVVKRRGMEWLLGGAGTHVSKGASSKSTELIDYGVDRTSAAKGSDRYTVLYGQVLSPQVSAVEVTFNNGKSLRDESPDGLFALVAQGATGVCDIRVFGYDNQILQRHELISRNTKTLDGNTCQPISGQL